MVKDSGVPILILDVNMGDVLNRLTIHMNDDYTKAVDKFALQLNLNHREHKRILNVVKEQLASLNLQPVEEDEEPSDYKNEWSSIYFKCIIKWKIR